MELEEASAHQCFRGIVSKCLECWKEVSLFPRSRFLSLVDSSVARSALSKRRSCCSHSFGGLRLSRLVFDLYPVFPFCPTRLNVADDPTRDAEIRGPVLFSIRKAGEFDLKDIAQNWAKALCCELVEAGDFGHLSHTRRMHELPMDFCQSLDF